MRVNSHKEACQHLFTFKNGTQNEPVTFATYGTCISLFLHVITVAKHLNKTCSASKARCLEKNKKNCKQVVTILFFFCCDSLKFDRLEQKTRKRRGSDVPTTHEVHLRKRKRWRRPRPVLLNNKKNENRCPISVEGSISICNIMSSAYPLKSQQNN